MGISCGGVLDRQNIRISTLAYNYLEEKGRVIYKKAQKAAKKFFNKAIKLRGISEKIAIDQSEANKAGIDVLKKQLKKSEETQIRQKKYPNNIVEQNHRFIKEIANPTIVSYVKKTTVQKFWRYD